MLREAEPVLVADRFPALLVALLNLLHSLTLEEWQHPVHGGEWTVKDLAQHLLGDEINILSGKRDRFSETFAPIHSWDALIALINRRNAEWVEATRRMSPKVICDLLRITGDQTNEHFRQLNLFATGSPVDWAGPDPAPVWLDVAREFTERWHHQQHIRDAVGKPGASGPEFLTPVIATFVHALPVTFRTVDAPVGTTVTLDITGPAGATWSVVRETERWQFYQGRPENPLAVVELPEGTAWRLFTKGISPAQAREKTRLTGDSLLGERVLETVSILA
jgi:uncharacterized protein (TIGR03083 family)